MRSSFWSLVIAAVALSGCADGRTQAAAPAGKKAAAPVATKTLRPALDVVPPPPTTMSSAESADDLASRLRAQKSPDALLVGLDETGAEKLFGAPQQRHDNATNKTWYYRDGSCALDLYFYMDMSSRVFRTLAYEVSSDDQSAESRNQCIARLQSAKQSAGTGNRQARD